MGYTKAIPAIVLALLLVLVGCGGSGEETAPEPEDPGSGSDGAGDGAGSGSDEQPTFEVGGSVTGLTGTGFVISNNGADELTIDADGAFAFAVELNDGDSYDVAIVTQPTAPANVCTIGNGSGTIAGADVVEIEILCTGPLALTASSPANDDQDVSRAIEPLLTFSAEVDGATVLDSAITLASDAGEVALSFDVTGTQVTLVPAATLLPLTEYTLTVTTNVLGSGGERMLDPATVVFRTRDAMWQADVEIDASGNVANDAQVAFDPDGNALALWYQARTDGTDIWWNYFTAGVGWGVAAVLEQNQANEYAGSPRVGFGNDGDAVAVWTLDDASTGSVRGSRYVSGAGWDAPAFIETEAGSVYGSVELAVNPNGAAVAVWLQDDGGQLNTWSNRYAAGSGWGTAEAIDDTADVVDHPRVAINGQGDVLAVWQVRDPGNFIWDVAARRYVVGSGWQAPEILSGDPFEGVNPRAVLDDDGNGLVIWIQGLGLDAAIHASRYTQAGGWTPPQELSVSGAIDDPQLAVDPFGSVIAVWRQRESVNGALELLPFAARHTATGWDAPQAIGNRTAFWPKAALDASGNAIAVWHELDLSLPLADAYSVWGNRFTVDNGWTAAEQIGSNGGLIGTGMPNVAVDTSGNALTIWTRSGEVRINRFE